MARLSWQRLALAALVAGVVAWLAAEAWLARGNAPVNVPWSVPLVLAVVTAVVLRLGLGVRAYQAGKNPSLDSLRAARTVVLAQASAYCGAVLSGAYAGGALVLVADWAHAPRREAAIAGLVAAFFALVVAVAGVIVERWCHVEPPDGGAETNAESSAA